MGHVALLTILLLCMVQAIVADLPVYTGCGAAIRGVPEGIIDYPGRNRRYPHNQDCNWSITLREGERLVLSFERFNLFKTDDTLTIKNGETGTLIGTYTWVNKLGINMPYIIESEANEIFLHFTSDAKFSGKGFLLTWAKIIPDVSESGDNQCLANTTTNSVLWNKVASSEAAVKHTVKQSKEDLIGLLSSKIQDLEFELEDIKYKQDETQSKLDFIIRLLMGNGCWSDMAQVTHPEGFSESHDCVMYTCTNGKWVSDGPDTNCGNTEPPIVIVTDGVHMVSAEPPYIPTDAPAPYIPTEAPVDCDYKEKSPSHTMTLPPNAACKITKSGLNQTERTLILNKHNELRNKVALGNEAGQPGAINMLEMKWNSELAAVAQAWAEQCFWGHESDYDYRLLCSRDYAVGQNMYKQWHWLPTSVWDEAVQVWYDEVKDMPLSHVSSYAWHNKVIGHYTQVVWAETYEVGCGASYFPEVYNNYTYINTKIYVCNYGPAGNYFNEPVYKIIEGDASPASDCPNGASETYPGLCATPIIL